MLDSLVNLYDEFAKSGRMLELQKLAQEQGLGFDKRAPFGIQPTAIKSFKIFQKKGTKRFIGIISDKLKDIDGTIRFYDYARTRDLETFTRSVVEVRTDQLYADYLAIEPKGVFSKMKGYFTSEDIDFPELKAFYDQFQISTRDPDAGLILQPSALDLIIDQPNMHIEAEGNYFVFYTKKKELPVQDVLGLMDFAEEFVTRLILDQSRDFV
ncbi:MAG: hypothetical protein KJP00_01455 [Bacteroidia bacterium]|nr:hypothetical protein [Bacteroidia bacterium]